MHLLLLKLLKHLVDDQSSRGFVILLRILLQIFRLMLILIELFWKWSGSQENLGSGFKFKSLPIMPHLFRSELSG